MRELCTHQAVLDLDVAYLRELKDSSTIELDIRCVSCANELHITRFLAGTDSSEMRLSNVKFLAVSSQHGTSQSTAKVTFTMVHLGTAVFIRTMLGCNKFLKAMNL